MNKTIYKLGLLLMVVVFAACSKDYLEIAPKGNLTNETFLRNAEEMKLALNGVYDNLQITNGSGTWTSMFFAKNLLGDESNAGGYPATDQQEYQYLDDYVIQSDNSKLGVMWANLYSSINYCNVLTEFAEGRTLSDEQKEIVAEAKALRAYIYFDLVTLWGDVPLFTVNAKTAEEYHRPRAAASEVWAQIEKDLNEAIPNLPNKSDLPNNEKHRFVKGPAIALLGKAYLFQEKFALAHQTLAPLANGTEYRLIDNFGDIWTVGQEFGDESLFEISYTSQESYNWGNIDWWPGTTQENNMEIVLQGARGEHFWMSADPVNDPEPLGIHLGGWGFNKPTKKIGDLFYAQPVEDVRRNLSVMSTADLATNGILRLTTDGTPGGPLKEATIHDYEGYLRIKYQTRSSEAPGIDDGAVTQMNMSTNWRVMRFADVLLLCAEAYNRDGKDAEARDLVNRVRKRAHAPEYTTESGDELFELIKKERQLELAFESHRFVDLVRWGDTDEFDSRWQSHMTVLPIPKQEIDANNALTDADQNPGY